MLPCFGMEHRFHPVRALGEINPARAMTAIAYAGGAAALVAYGLGAVALWRKVALFGAGASLLYRAMTAFSKKGAQIEIREAPVREREEDGIGLQAFVYSDYERDRVDEASYESFPASDPPGY